MAIGEFKGKYRFLSNFWMHPVEYEGIRYPSSEHAYQAAKVYDGRLKAIFAAVPTAGDVKLLGANIVVRPDWYDVNLQIMEDILLIKFSDPKLKQMLLDTGTEDLIEGNTWGDTFWGVCRGKGENHLGKILMKIRLTYSGTTV